MEILTRLTIYTKVVNFLYDSTTKYYSLDAHSLEHTQSEQYDSTDDITLHLVQTM